MKKSAYQFIFYLMALPAVLVLGLQAATVGDQYGRIEREFGEDVARAVGQTQQVYAGWISHTSNEYDPNTYDSLYVNADSSFVFMVAQSSQAYPLLSFRPDTALPRLRREQFLRFKDELEQTRPPSAASVKEFYVFRAIQFCQNCREDELSVAEVFPLDSTIRANLQEVGLDLAADIGFFDLSEKRYGFLSNPAAEAALDASPFQYNFVGREQLRVHFPNRQLFIWGKFASQIGLPVALTCLSLLAFGWAAKMLFRQKKLEAMKNDFINNVTHEFKTPISTIAFAVANIENEKVLGNPAAVKQLTGIIRQENKRLNEQVEKVLLAAMTEQEVLEMRREAVNMHQVINQIADAYEWKVGKDRLQRRLNAARAEIWGDAFHLSNAISNLLDNAVKYAHDGGAEIVLSTSSDAEGFTVEVADRGIGIGREQQQLIFEKFYRVPTGNLHDVKGFGLGLSYVKNIVERHKGRIQLQSKVNSGSTFTLFFPFQ